MSVSANDHFLFQTPLLDGLTALAAALDRSGGMDLATTVSLVARRGPVPLAREADRVLRDVLSPLLKRDAEALRDQLSIGSAESCAELLSRYAQAGCERVHLWPLGDEVRQVELAATAVLTAVED